MKFCTNCGQKLDDIARFCTNCGKPSLVILQSAPVNPVPTVQPEIPVNPVPTVQPDVPINPIPTVQPEVPVNPVPVVQPDVPINPIPTVQPEVPVNPVPAVQPEVPINPIPTVQPEVPVDPVPAVRPEVPVNPVPTVQPEISVNTVISEAAVTITSSDVPAPVNEEAFETAAEHLIVQASESHAEPVITEFDNNTTQDPVVLSNREFVEIKATKSENNYYQQPAQNQFNGQPSQNQFNGQPAQNQFNGQPAQNQFNGQPSQNQFNGQSAQNQFNGQPAQNQFNGQPAQSQFNSQAAQNQFNGQPAQQYPGHQQNFNYQQPNSNGQRNYYYEQYGNGMNNNSSLHNGQYVPQGSRVPFQPQNNLIFNSNVINNNIDATASIIKSPLFIIAFISFAIITIISFVSIFNFSSGRMLSTYSSFFDDIGINIDELYTLTRTSNIINIIANIIFQIPSLLMLIGMLCLICSQGKRPVPSVGFSFMKAFVIIKIIFTSLLLALTTVIMIIVLVAGNNILDRINILNRNTSLGISVVLIIVFVILVIVFTLILVYYGCINKTITCAKKAGSGVEISKNGISVFVPVIGFIAALFQIISLSSLIVFFTKGNIVLVISCIATIVFYITISIAMLVYRSKLQVIKYQPTYRNY